MRAAAHRSACPAPARRAARRRSRPGWPSPPTAAALRLRQPVQPPARARHRDGRGPADVRRRRRALRCRPRRRQSLRQQLGRAPAAAGRPHRPGRPRHRGPGRPGAAHRQRRLGQRHRPRAGHGRRPRSSSSSTPRPWPSRPTAATSSAPTPPATTSASSTRATDTVVETIWAKPSPADLFGAPPNALAFDPTGKTLYVANGTQNAVAVDRFRPGERESEAARADPRRLVPRRARLRRRARNRSTSPTSRACGSSPTEATSRRGGPGLQLAPVPRLGLARSRAAAEDALATLTDDRLRQLSAASAIAAGAARRRGPASRRGPSPSGSASRASSSTSSTSSRRTAPTTRSSATSTQGNGDPSLCIFGEKVTPNQHKLVREFVLLDNTYCSGILSADGHQWCDDGLRHRLHGEVLRRLPAQLSRRHGRGRDRRPGLRARPASSGTTPCARQDAPQLRRVHDARRCGWTDPTRKGEPDLRPTTGDEYINGRGEVGSSAASRPSRSLAPYLADRLRRLGHGRPRPVPGRVIHRASSQEFETEGRVPAPHHHLPAQRPHQRHAARARPTPAAHASPTTTSPSAGSSRPSATARSGRRRPSSASRTIRRTAGTTSAATARRPTASAPTRSAAPSSARSTTRPASCGRSSRSSACRR